MTFVETGTFTGKTTEIASRIFKSVYTIELGKDLFQKVRKKFEGTKNITCLEGESSHVLAKLIPKITEDAIFFLDAHWAGELSVKGNLDSPLMEELTILSKRNVTNQDLIIIDDVGFFNKKSSIFYPNPKADSLYFPNGGLFEWDWKHIDKQKVLDLFPGKKSVEMDDRLFIGVR
ncbi:hypothetical protein EPO17_01260 [Patescibacteria group bacterium]|nr:MAG: hypothetical protein EPO17_01260 [Patescibacteria group bacterium]